MSINRGNSVILMNNEQFNSNIPEHFKTRYWIKNLDDSYTVRTWKELTEDDSYKLGHGGTSFIENGVLTIEGGAPINVGDVYVVSINASAMRGDVGHIIGAGFTYYLNFSEGNKFIEDNRDED